MSIYAYVRRLYQFYTVKLCAHHNNSKTSKILTPISRTSRYFELNVRNYKVKRCVETLFDLFKPSSIILLPFQGGVSFVDPFCYLCSMPLL